jgi:hypothetical protein
MIARLACAAFAAILPILSQAADLSCPEKLAVTETVAPLEGWKATGGQTEHAFERVSIFNGTPGGQEYDLAPDLEKKVATRVTQTWKLKDYRSMNIFLRCRYHDTTAVLFRDVPAALQTCTLTFTLEKNGDIVGKSAAICR